MIIPTNGRIVWFTPGRDDDAMVWHDVGAPLAAIICHVWNERCVNLVVFDGSGHQYRVTSVSLLQDDDVAPEGRRHAFWMPYQKGQAARTAEVEKQLALGV